ncbi:MAG: hypothetical protein RAK22_02600 [Nanoarchaeota archaeon]|nr:hypothetical protein [Nanoarchaeota archaeon]
MNFTFFLLPLSVIKSASPGSDSDGSYLLLNGIKIYRLHLVGTIINLDLDEDKGSGYLIVDDTFSSVLVHFQRPLFKYFENIGKGDMVEVLGTVENNDNGVVLSLNNIKKINLERYMYNKLECIKNLQELMHGI